MVIVQEKYSPSRGWETVGAAADNQLRFNLVLVFGSPELIADPDLPADLREKFPHAELLINSTAGEITGTSVNDNSLSLTAIAFEHTVIHSASVQLKTGENSYEAGCRLSAQLDSTDLRYLMVISDGQHVNGSELVNGLKNSLPENVIITGGLAGDGVNFRKTFVGLNGPAVENCIAAIGFYGQYIAVNYGSVGGWDPFGPERLITRADGNILYELDGKPALEIYKKYLGDYAEQLPSAGLFFPLSIRDDGKDALVRTILAVDETANSLVFAGNMPEGSYARLMKASIDRLIEGAAQAARDTLRGTDSSSPQLAILISCVGRKLVLNQRIEEEVEVIQNVYGAQTALTGFYSYGEISPSYTSPGPELHNQTMTITTITEHHP